MDEPRNLDEVAVACPRSHVMAVLCRGRDGGYGWTFHETDRDREVDREWPDSPPAGELPARRLPFATWVENRTVRTGRSRPAIPPTPGMIAVARSDRDPQGEHVHLRCRRCSRPRMDGARREVGRVTPTFDVRWSRLTEVAEGAFADGMDLVRVYGDGTISAGRKSPTF
jgi:hypothetical protein